MSYTPTTFWVYPAGCWVDLDTGNIIPAANIAAFTNKVQLTKWTSSSSVGNTVWVSKIGDNSYGNGTPEKPFRTINFGLAQLQARNTAGCLVVDEMNGSPWNETIDMSFTSQKKMFFSFSQDNALRTSFSTGNIGSVYRLKNMAYWLDSEGGTFYSSKVLTASRFGSGGYCIVTGGSLASPVQASGIGGSGNIASSFFVRQGRNCTKSIIRNSGLIFSTFRTMAYCSFISSYFSTDAIPDNVTYGIVASQWAWLTNAWVLYDGVAAVSAASITPNRMYRITANPNATSIAGVSYPSISATAAGTYFVSKDTAAEITRNGLVLEMQAHDLQAWRDRYWRRFAVNIGTDVLLNFYGCKIFDSSHDPFIDSANGNYTLKADSWEATAGPNFEPIGSFGIGRTITTADIWQGEPMQNVTIVNATKATMDTTSLSRFKTNVFNWTGMKLKNLDLIRLDNAVNGEWFALESNIGNTATALVEGKVYINSSTGMPITLAGGRVISVNQPFVALTGETSFTGVSTVYEVILRKLCVRLRVSQSAFSADDASVSWFKFAYGQQALVNRVGNVETGAITAGTGDDSFDPTVAFPLGSWNYFQFEILCQKNEMKGI